MALSIATDFREYVRGDSPADWTEWRAGGVTGQSTNPVDGTDEPAPSQWLTPATSFGTIHALTWDAAGASEDQDILVLVRASNHAASGGWVAGRVDAAARNGYGVRVVPGALRVVRIAAGTATTLATSSTFQPHPEREFWIRFRLAGTALKARAWLSDEAEPGTWLIETTDATYAEGAIGFLHAGSANASMELLQFAVATGGGIAEPLAESFAALVADPTRRLAHSLELRSVSATDASESVRTDWFGSTPLSFGPADYPPDVEAPPFLLPDGLLSVQIEGDPLLADLAPLQAPSIVLRNARRPGLAQRPLTELVTDRSVDGQRLVLRVGPAGGRGREFGVLAVLYAAGEAMAEADRVLIQTASAGQRLDQPIPLGRHAGIPTCQRALVADGGRATTASNAALAVRDFSAMVMLRATIGFPRTDAVVWQLGGNAALECRPLSGEPYLALLVNGSTVVEVSAATVAAEVNTDVGIELSENWLRIGVGARVGELPYISVNGFHAFGDAVIEDWTPATVAASFAGFGDTMAFGVLGYRSPSEMDALLALPRTILDEADVVGFWPCDDGALSTITDYGPSGLDATVSGVVDTDFSWVASDEGEADLAGTAKQIALGTLRSLPLPRIDATRERYRLTSGYWFDVGTDLQVYAQGFALDAGDHSALDKVIEMTAAQEEPVTADCAAGDVGIRSPLSYLWRYRLGWQARVDYDDYALQAADAFASVRLGILIEDDVAARDATLRLANSCGMGLLVDDHGQVAPLPLLPANLAPPRGAGNRCLEVRGRAAAFVPLAAEWNAIRTIAFWVQPWSTAGDADFPILQRRQRNLATAYEYMTRTYTEIGVRGQGAGDGAVPYLRTTANLTAWTEAEGDAASRVGHGDWVFVVCKRSADAAAWSILTAVAGAPLRTVATSGTPAADKTGAAADEVLVIGAGAWASLSELSLWTTTLSDGDAQALMTTPPTAASSGIAMWLPLDDRGGSILEAVQDVAVPLREASMAPAASIDLRPLAAPARRRLMLRAASEAAVPYARNLQPLADSEFAAGVADADRIGRRAERRVATVPNGRVLVHHPRPRRVEVAGDCLADGAAARAIAERLLRRVGDGRGVQVELENLPRELALLAVGSLVWLYDGDGMEYGVAARVVGRTRAIGSLRPTLVLVTGERLGVVIGADADSPIRIDSTTDEVLGG